MAALPLRPTRLAALALSLAAALAACGPARSPQPADAGAGGTIAALPLGDLNDSLTSDNGMSMNGMSMNGMSMNGMSMNGLTTAAVSNAAFAGWFNGNAAANDELMRYVVRCAAPAGKSYSFYSATTKRTHTWSGNLGVAPGWVGGAAITTAEQQLVSACLAAHVNKFGWQIDIAVEGRDGRGVQLPMGPFELWDYDARESCFFGNLFTGDGIYAGIDHDFTWDETMSSPRACAFDGKAIGTSPCPPIKLAGYCSQLCVPDGYGYSTCTYGGKTYKALTTRISSWWIGYCGDGWCDPQEKCGTPAKYWTWDSCAYDCGYCH